MRAAVLVLLGLALIVCVRARADEAAASELLASAASEYSEAMGTAERAARLEGFRRSERLFAALAHDHGIHNAALYVNWGNAALQARRIGPAVLAYRRALVLDPGDAQARENLTEARGLLPAWVPRPRDETLTSTFFFWRHAMSRSARLALSAVLFLAACVLLATWIRWSKAWARNLAVLPLLLWAALVAMPLLDAESTAGSDAVVTADEAVVRAADSPGAPTKFAEPLPGGTEVEAVETRGDWARVRLADGREGWVSQGSIAFVDTSTPDPDLR